ncbi:MAG: DDE transposase, partial [Candidatus Heimdallarchaeaceae archaeon]
MVKLLLHIWRVLTEEDKHRFKEQFEPYVNKTSGQYIYFLQPSDIPHELEKIAQLYYWIHQHLQHSYAHCTVFQTFERVYCEQFTVTQQKIEMKPSEHITTSSVQSPDDLDATYRNKNGKDKRGQSINVVETANPENKLNLITDVSVHPVNKDDSKVLTQRLEPIKEKTPQLEELHFDGAYGSSDNDKQCEKHRINAVHTAVRGPKTSVEFGIEKVSDTHYTVSCPQQTVVSVPSRK